MGEKIEKYHLNLAGEYRVCAELLKRNIFATVTFGNMKSADVMAVGPNRRAAVVEVKASSSTRFVTGFYQMYKTADLEHPDFWVLYSVQPDGDTFIEQFFVLSHEELEERQAIRNHSESLPYLERVRRAAGGVDNILLDPVKDKDCKDRWEKIVDWCSQDESP